MASSGPRALRPSVRRPCPFPLETEGEWRGLEGECQSWGGRGERTVPLRSREWDEPGRAKRTPGMEDRGSYGASNQGSRGRPWLPPRGNEEAASWGGVHNPPWESWSSDMGDKRGSWGAPQKRLRSTPVDEWVRVPLRSPRGRGSTSPAHRRDYPGNGGTPWGSPATESMGWPPESPVLAKTLESSRDSELTTPASGPAMESRDWERSRWPEEHGRRSSGDPAWQTRQDNPVGGSSQAGGSGESWNGCQSFRSQSDLKEDSRAWNHGRPRGWQDGGCSMGSPRESLPPQAPTSFQENFLGFEGRPRRDEGPGMQAKATRTWFPRAEVLDYWEGCQSLLNKKARNKFLSFCPRPSIPEEPPNPPRLNAGLQLPTKTATHIARHSQVTQREVLDMLAPAMALYEKAEEAHERRGRVDPLVVRQLAHSLLSLAGSVNRRLTLQRCSEVLEAIDPRLRVVTAGMAGRNSSGLLFAEDSVDILKGVILSFPELPKEPPERDFGHCLEVARPPSIASPPEFAPPFRDGAAPFYEHYSDQQAQNQDETSLELWHRRFGHTQSNIIVRLQNNKLATGIKVAPGEVDSTARCLTCLIEKGEKPPFPLNTARSSTVSMDLIHCELSGPFDVPSLLLQRYVLIFVDDFSRFCVTYLLKETGEVHRFFEVYLAMLRKKQDSKPKVFQLNSAADVVSPQTQAFLEAQGIAHKRGVESLPGKCRTAEKEMKSLLEMTRCMLVDAELPDPFWGHAILTASYLWNRLPCKRKGRTPFQGWYGKVPNVKHLRVFGSLVRLSREPDGPTKYIFVSYGAREIGYRVMNLETGVVFLKRTVGFDEREGVEKRGGYLDAVERVGCNIEALKGTGSSMAT